MPTPDLQAVTTSAISAILDRLINNAHRLPLDGPSLRKIHNAGAGGDLE